MSLSFAEGGLLSRRRPQFVVETVDSDGGDNTWAGPPPATGEARRAASTTTGGPQPGRPRSRALRLGPVHRSREGA